MGQNSKIGIVEDEVIIADSIRLALVAQGYNVVAPCATYDQAVAMLENERPDLVLLDVKLKRGKDGIEVARYIRENAGIPFVFLTANSDRETLERAKPLKPGAFLIKPFKKEDLYSAIEIAISNFGAAWRQDTGSPPRQSLASGAIFIKEGHYFHKVMFDDILYLSSEHVYVTIQTREKKFLVRTSLQEYLEKFDPAKFVRVHQRFAVNIDAVDKINSTCLVIGDMEIPVSKSYQQAMLNSLNLG